ncbi:MAG: hypothetical protein ACT6XY_06965 [Phreatobacter sp.]|jgi:hypothetical protein|uniref:hypothetical protein n=1 Tax=Phreatobacter sp. TaxID=1966341 RepID=UPI0040359312
MSEPDIPARLDAGPTAEHHLQMNQNLDDPAVKRRLVVLLLKLTPFAFVLCWVLAALQGAPAFTCTVIAGAAAGATLGAAVSIGLFGSGSRYVFMAVAILIGLANALMR